MSSQPRSVVWSFGGGTQSVAIAVLVAQGRLPKPARVVMADTGREASATWEYLHNHVQPLLSLVGLTIEIVRNESGLPSMYGPSNKPLIPAWTADGAQLRTFCSGEWKRDVILRHLRSCGYGPSSPVQMWLGISLDEMHRARPGQRKWAQHHWPLLTDCPMSRGDCRAVIAEAGLPMAPKSSCWMCPYRRDEQWQDLRDNYPQDWQQALDIDAEIRENDARGILSLHRSGVPLAEVTLVSEARLPLLVAAGCDTGMCWV